MPRPRTLRLLIVIGLAAAGFVTLGLPGILVLEAAIVLLAPVSPAQLGGDQFWPAALGISLIGPFAALPVDHLVQRLHLGQWRRIALTACATVLLLVLATAAGIMLAAG